jgi:hypothetical protein
LSLQPSPGEEFYIPSNEEERRLRVFENRVLRKVLGPTREEITAGWEELHNEKLHNLYYSPNIIMVIK